MIEKAEVEEEEGKQWADELGAIFQKTSAKNKTGIEELFNKIGEKFIELYNKSGNNLDNNKGKNETNNEKMEIKLEKGNDNEKRENGYNYC